jgi:hypothetical protein
LRGSTPYAAMELISMQQLVFCRQDKEGSHEVYKYRVRRGASTYKYLRASTEWRFYWRQLSSSWTGHKQCHHRIVNKRNNRRDVEPKQWSWQRRCRGEQRSKPVGKYPDQSLAQRVNIDPDSRLRCWTVDP